MTYLVFGTTKMCNVLYLYRALYLYVMNTNFTVHNIKCQCELPVPHILFHISKSTFWAVNLFEY